MHKSLKILNYPRIQDDLQSLYPSKNFDYVLENILCISELILLTVYLILMVHDNFWKSCLHYQELFHTVLGCISNENSYSKDDNIIKNSFKCTNPYTCFITVANPVVDHYRAASSRKKVKKELHSNLYSFNQIETSGLLGSSDQQPVAEESPLGTGAKVISKAVETSNYATDKLPGATASHDQYYETNDAPVLSKEETRKNVRPVPKETDVDSILQSYQKAQITPTTVGYTAPPVVQTKTKPPPAKTVPSSSGSKSHKSLPRRSCLVYLKEQYHLDVDLLAQPRATKYLVKVRTEISPGRYMAKLELHCSR